MRKSLRKSSVTARAIRIIILSAVIVILILLLASYIILHNYINKLNLVDSSYVDNQESEISDEIIVNPELEVEPEDEPIDELIDKPIDEPDESLDLSEDSPEDEIKSLEDEIRLNMEGNSTPIMYDEDVFNILLIGSDTRDGASGRSDAMIIISINKKTKTITETSLLRDIYLQIPGRKNNRINTAYAYGGPELLLETIKQNFNLDISRYASINMDSFVNIVDALGGITMEVTEEEIPFINGYVKEANLRNGERSDKDILTEPGTYLLNGIKVQAYVRNRDIGMDFERTNRQRKVLEQIYNQVKKLSLLEINDFMNIVLPHITTNLTEGELYSLILSLPIYKGYALDKWSIPVEDSYSFMKIRGMSVIGIDFEENIEELSNRIYGMK